MFRRNTFIMLALILLLLSTSCSLRQTQPTPTSGANLPNPANVMRTGEMIIASLKVE
jgi:hypothetical protein